MDDGGVAWRIDLSMFEFDLVRLISPLPPLVICVLSIVVLIYLCTSLSITPPCRTAPYASLSTLPPTTPINFNSVLIWSAFIAPCAMSLPSAAELIARYLRTGGYTEVFITSRPPHTRVHYLLTLAIDVESIHPRSRPGTRCWQYFPRWHINRSDPAGKENIRSHSQPGEIRCRGQKSPMAYTW